MSFISAYQKSSGRQSNGIRPSEHAPLDKEKVRATLDRMALSFAYLRQPIPDSLCFWRRPALPAPKQVISEGFSKSKKVSNRFTPYSKKRGDKRAPVDLQWIIEHGFKSSTRLTQVLAPLNYRFNFYPIEEGSEGLQKLCFKLNSAYKALVEKIRKSPRSVYHFGGTNPLLEVLFSHAISESIAAALEENEIGLSKQSNIEMKGFLGRLERLKIQMYAIPKQPKESVSAGVGQPQNL